MMLCPRSWQNAAFCDGCERNKTTIRGTYDPGSRNSNGITGTTFVYIQQSHSTVQYTHVRTSRCRRGNRAASIGHVEQFAT